MASLKCKRILDKYEELAMTVARKQWFDDIKKLHPDWSDEKINRVIKILGKGGDS